MALIILLMLFGLGLYPLLVAGWSSRSAYAAVGAVRGVAQTLSYEVRIALFMLSLLIPLATLRWGDLSQGLYFPLLALGAPRLAGWLICAVAERNRTPFDFAEGESELVSGFNVEFGGGPFAAIFMAEYASILALRGSSSLIATFGAIRYGPAVLSVGLGVGWV